VAVEYLPVAEAAEVPEGGVKVVTVAGTPIALLNVGGEIFALEHSCPHQGGPIGEGEICGTTITCPWHEWKFDIRTGANDRDPTILAKTYAVRVVEGVVLVEVSRVLSGARRNREILRRLTAGESAAAIGRDLELSEQEVTRTADAARISERLHYLAEVYSRKSRVGGSDVRGLPYRRAKEADGEMLSALDALTRLL
jgi:nitrite reductase/ring-hydroxylating ferredoxin subunit